MIQLQLPSERATADRSRLIQLFLWCGAISGPLAVLVITIDGFLRPGYSPISQVVSDLGIGENAWILNTTLMVSGQVSMLFALGFSQSRTAPGAGMAGTRSSAASSWCCSSSSRTPCLRL